MSNTLIAVRHGETEWNRSGRQQGHLDSGLTGLGKKQAEAMADGLKKFRIDLIYSSDLGRAVQTAEIIAKTLGTEFSTDARLRERNLGILQGLTKAEFATAYPQDSAGLNSGNPDYVIPGGESVRQRFNRTVGCVEDLCRGNPGRTLLLVAHGGVLMSFIHKALGIPLTAKRSFSLYNGSINVFMVTDNLEWSLETWGDINHMQERNLETIDDN